MGLPAVRHDMPSRSPRPRLALVEVERSGKRRSEPVARSRVCHSVHCRNTFKTFLAVAILFAGLGVARVGLASRAAAVSIESGRMRQKIKEARFVGDSLEIKISQLATPSRIRAIAGKKMKMAPAAGIWYMTIDGSKQPKPPTAKKSVLRAREVPVVRPKAGESLLSSIMHTAAGEAQVLLLGDVGLASTR